MEKLLIAYGVYYLYCKKVEQDQTVRRFPQQKNIGNPIGGDLKKSTTISGQHASMR